VKASTKSITLDRKIKHPAIAAITESARKDLSLALSHLKVDEKRTFEDMSRDTQ